MATGDGPVRALTFAMNRKSARYIADLTDEAAGRYAGHRRAAFAARWPSTCSRPCSKLEELGIHDRNLWRLQALVADRIDALIRPIESLTFPKCCSPLRVRSAG